MRMIIRVSPHRVDVCIEVLVSPREQEYVVDSKYILLLGFFQLHGLFFFLCQPMIKVHLNK